MIVVDTNVWSETLRPDPHPAVLSWLTARAADVHMAVTTVHELKFGIELLPTGRRRAALETRIEQVLTDLRPRVLAYDDRAARVHALLRAQARRAGRQLSAEDGQIAAITQVADAALATRNTPDFADLGIRLVDPWRHQAEPDLRLLGSHR